jgi:DNA-binding response OmpR family regulator
MSRVLIVEDDAPLRAIFRQILEKAGHTVFDAAYGRKGMALWHREQTDVVVTDLYMPEKDGVEVLLEMKRYATQTKIIVMSGGGTKGLLDWSASVLSLRADGVLEKPFDKQKLLTVIQDVLAHPPATTQPVPSSRMTDQRKYTRSAVSLPVSFGDGDRVLTGVVLDISREGCRIHCTDPFTDLQYFQVQIQLVETRERIWVDLAVRRWVRNGDLGVEFIKMKPEDQARLRTLIRTCEEGCNRQREVGTRGARSTQLAIRGSSG